MTVEEKELELLREAVEKSEKRMGYKIVQSDLNKTIMTTVEQFIKDKKLICYGGTAINNLLPIKAQFYNKNFELPDYDVFSKSAVADAKALTNIFFKKGFENVETRTAMTVGTYKVYVNFYPVVDITMMDPRLYDVFLRKGEKKDGIHYSPVNFLRMELYKELSHPQGEIKRWEKVYKRLTILNKYFPLRENCHQTLNFNRHFKGNQNYADTLKEILLKNEDVVFIGGYATNLYKKHLPHSAEEKGVSHHSVAKQTQDIPDFDILAVNAKKTAADIKDKLREKGVTEKIEIVKKPELWKIIPVHYEISIDKNIVCVVYETIACHSYNVVKEDGVQIKVAAIDTLVNFLLAFIFSDTTYYDETRIMCMAEYLIQVQKKTRMNNKGLFRRFSINCYGTQQSVENMRELKSEKFRILKNKKNSSEYQKYFLRYNPLEELEHQERKVKKTLKKKKKQNRTFKNKIVAKFINPLKYTF
jgi:hypothetical protein